MEKQIRVLFSRSVFKNLHAESTLLVAGFIGSHRIAAVKVGPFKCFGGCGGCSNKRQRCSADKAA